MTTKIGRYSLDRLIRFYKSDSPIIILSGHGGNSPIDINPRVCNTPHDCDCRIGGDEYINNIAEIISRSLNSSVVIADFDRLYIDVNRSPVCAYEDPKGELYYNIFHNKVREFINYIKSRCSIGFLFDLHGTRMSDHDIYIGTHNGNSIKQLLSIDPYAINILRNLFIDSGYTFQPKYRGEKEMFQGRYILQAYGDKINSIQIEISTNIRRDPKFINHLSEIIRNFVNLYDEYQSPHITTCITPCITIDDVMKYADENMVNEEDLNELLKILIMR